MTLEDRLTEVFDRGLRDGVESLAPVDRELFRIQDFIIEFEMNGLSGYFYNRLPDLEEIAATVAAMRKHGMAEAAALLAEGAELFASYIDPVPATTWSAVLRQYDPTDRLDELASRIGELENYGIPDGPAPPRSKKATGQI